MKNKKEADGVNEHLEKLLKEQKIIQTLALRHDGKMVELAEISDLNREKTFTSLQRLTLPQLRIHSIRVQRLSMKDLIDYRYWHCCWNLSDRLIHSLVLIKLKSWRSSMNYVCRKKYEEDRMKIVCCYHLKNFLKD